MFRATRPLLESSLGLKSLAKRYQSVAGVEPKEVFVQKVIENLDLSFRVTEGDPDRIPKKGPVIIVANHPYGGLEGVLLAHFLSSIRPDIKLMANFLLTRIPEMKDFFIAVDPFDGPQSWKNNIAPLRESIDWVNKGGMLCVFPSGAVSHFHWKGREVVDPPWSLTVSRIIQKTQAPVVPLFFDGRNGSFFQLMGLIHPLLRTILLPRELLNKHGKEIAFRIGNIIPHEKLAGLNSQQEIIDYLRLRTYILGHRDKPGDIIPKHKKQVDREEPAQSDNFDPVSDPQDPELHREEVRSLPSEQLIAQADDMQVYYANAQQIPHLLHEIGRQREITFRSVKEGTGKPIDIDHYDNYYRHLFLWSKAKQEIVGAYRLIETDRALKQFGRKGLYSYSLFSYQRSLVHQMGPALELGRSFIRQEYQRSYAPLLMLWKGICAYVLKNPKYRILFGTVCINNEYDSVSRQLIISFLEETSWFPELANQIRARNPMRRIPLRGVDSASSSVVVKDLDGMSEILHELEAKHRQIPVLLRQYLKMGGKILGFNVDENFGDVLDGLIYVDLMETDPRLLSRFMGKDGVKQFRSFHEIGNGTNGSGDTRRTS
jgi:putative hemolysin